MSAAEKLEYLVKLAVEAYDRAECGDASRMLFIVEVRERMAQAAQCWEIDASEARES